MGRLVASRVVLCLAVAACGRTTASVVIDTRVENLENGTFEATGDLFGCDGRWGTLEMQLNDGDSWFFDGDYVCSDGSGMLVIRIEGDGPEPEPGDDVGSWKVVSGTGDYEGFTGNGTYHLSLRPWTETLEGELTSG